MFLAILQIPTVQFWVGDYRYRLFAFCPGGVRPLRACGTRFIGHKVAALDRLIDNFGAYLSHLAILSEDPGVKDVDRQKLKGYIKRWEDGKVLLSCALFSDLLKPASILCKTLQEEELCSVCSIEPVMKTKKALEKVSLSLTS